MSIVLTDHAKQRMREHEILESQTEETIYAPDAIIPGPNNRKIFQKRLNSHVLRVIIEEINGEIIVITTYKARAKRYEVRV